MMRFSYAVFTLIAGFALQLICSRYVALHGVAPDLLLLFVVAHGFLCGPFVGEVMGFFWGAMADSMGSQLFGMQSLLLTLAGYLTGRLRRRVASERPTGQIVIALIATSFYGLGASFVTSIFDPGAPRVSIWLIFFQALFNALIMPIVFVMSEKWMELWAMDHEHL